MLVAALYSPVSTVAAESSHEGAIALLFGLFAAYRS